MFLLTVNHDNTSVEAIPESDADARGLKIDLVDELNAVTLLMQPDDELVAQLFRALERGEKQRAQDLRDQLVSGGVLVQRALDDLEERVSETLDRLVESARQREQIASVILIVLGAVTLLVGTLMALSPRIWPGT